MSPWPSSRCRSELAFGVASGAGAAAGLVTAVVAGCVAAVLGGSHLQVSGPTGAMAVILLPIVAHHGAGAVATVAVMAGVVVVLGGVLGLGRLMAYLPWPVVEGFTLGIAVVIAAQQVPVALGVPTPDGTNASLVAVEAVVRFVGQGDVVVVGLLVLAVVLTAGLAKLHHALPAALVAVGVVTGVAELAHLDVARIGALPRGLPAPSVPDLSQAGPLLSAAVAVAALAALESLLSARVADGMTNHERHDSDRELVGQGLANVASGLFGGLPATGALARTAVNVRSGARTRLASLSHAVVLALMMAAAAGLVGRIPLVALAGVLLVTAVRMVDRRAVAAVLRSTRTDGLVLLLTAGATIVLDLVRAVEIGIVVSVVVALVRLSRTTEVVDDSAVLVVSDPEESALLRQHVLVYRVDGPLFFAATTRFLHQLVAGADVRVIVLRLGNLLLLDASGARAVAEIVRGLREQNVHVVVKVSSPEHTRLLRAVGALDSLEVQGRVLGDLPAALSLARTLAVGDPVTDPPAAEHPETEGQGLRRPCGVTTGSAAAQALAVGPGTQRVDALGHRRTGRPQRLQPLVHGGRLLLGQRWPHARDLRGQLVQRHLVLAVPGPHQVHGHIGQDAVDALALGLGELACPVQRALQHQHHAGSAHGAEHHGSGVQVTGTGALDGHRLLVVVPAATQRAQGSAATTDLALELPVGGALGLARHQDPGGQGAQRHAQERVVDRVVEDDAQGEEHGHHEQERAEHPPRDGGVHPSGLVEDLPDLAQACEALLARLGGVVSGLAGHGHQG